MTARDTGHCMHVIGTTERKCCWCGAMQTIDYESVPAHGDRIGLAKTERYPFAWTPRKAQKQCPGRPALTDLGFTRN